LKQRWQLRKTQKHSGINDKTSQDSGNNHAMASLSFR